MKLLEAKGDALIELLNIEGDDSPADLLILADQARLDRTADMNLFQTIDSDALNQAKVSAERLGELYAQALELMAANGWQ